MQLTNAAPPFDIDLFLDELLEMNIRMGDIILKAKYEYKRSKDNELIDTPIDNYNNRHEDNSIAKLDEHETETNSNESSPSQHSNIFHDLFNKSPANGYTEGRPEKIGRSFVGQTLDALGNPWNNIFGREKITENDEDNSQSHSVIAGNGNEVIGSVNVDGDIGVANTNTNIDGGAVHKSPYDQPFEQHNEHNDGFQDPNTLGILYPFTDNGNSNNAEVDNVETEVVEPNNNDSDFQNLEAENENGYHNNSNSGNLHSDNSDSDSEHTESENVEQPDNAQQEQQNTEPQNAELDNVGSDDAAITNPEITESENQIYQQGEISDNVGHELDRGEETFNNESEDDDGGSWFSNAIDSIVNFFG